MHIVCIGTYAVHTNEEGLRISGVRWGVRKSTQEVETSRTAGRVSRCITAIWHSRVHIIPAEYHTGCVGLWNNQCDIKLLPSL